MSASSLKSSTSFPLRIVQLNPGCMVFRIMDRIAFEQSSTVPKGAERNGSLRKTVQRGPQPPILRIQFHNVLLVWIDVPLDEVLDHEGLPVDNHSLSMSR